MPRNLRTLLVDLNNFARYPTVAVGYLTAALRQDAIDVELFSPLDIGIDGVEREPRARPWSLIDERLRYRSATSRNRIVRSVRRTLAERRRPTGAGNRRRILEHFEARLAERPDVVLISAYLMYFEVCTDLCRAAEKRGIPVVIGGAYLNQAPVARRWLTIPGLTAIVAGEAESFVADLVRAIAKGEDLSGRPGVWTPGGPDAVPLAPLRDLDRIAYPDYGDFPWQRYPEKIVPILAGRGCGWGVCSFCSDVTSSMGRTFRSRSPGHVLGEIEYQAHRFGASRFIFVDLKLNSQLPVWHGIIDGIAKRVPAVEWAASVHVDANGEHGLDAASLAAARAAGLVRVTTGLESGSQALLDRMSKGTNLETTSRFLHDARDAELSVRTTMIVGYPGETKDDLRETADFLERHSNLIERVSLNRLSIILGTPLHRRFEAGPDRFPDLADASTDATMGVVEHRHRAAEDRDHRKAVEAVLAAVHRINRRPLRRSASAFDGVM